MPDSPLGWVVLVVAYVLLGVGALAFVAFVVASVTWGTWQLAKMAWSDLRPRTPPPRGFDVLPPKPR